MAHVGHNARQLVTHAGSQPEPGQARGQRVGSALLVELAEDCQTGRREQIEGPQQPVSCRRQLRAAAAAAADRLLHQWRTREVAEGFDRLPGGLLADAGAARRFGDGAGPADAAQHVDALVGGVVPKCSFKLKGR
ncbi:hypothetical protein [Thauera humireducens]|uniref:hypothetical protein n=1 Tax=Thauera humireducens TaxID=1134435 RepID=UPI00311E1C5C